MMSRVSLNTDTRTRTSTEPGAPPATRARRSRWRDPRLVLGIAIVAASVLLGALLVGRADDSVLVWAARTGLRAGQPVRADDLVRARVRFADPAAANRYLSASSTAPTGARLARDVGAGEFLPRAALTGARPDPLTEVPLSVDTGAVPATVGPGSVVDVWVTPDPAADPGRPGPVRAVRVFDDVAVVAAPRTGTSLGPSSTRQVIVGVGAEQEAALPKAFAALAGGTVVITRKQ